MNNIDLSIIIPCYNHGDYLQETVDSIFTNMGSFNYEVIIINDGSTDVNTINVINSFNTNNIKVINQSNQGLAKARNNGIKTAKGTYILPLDSDNNVTQGYLQKALEILKDNSEIDIVYGNAKYIGEKQGVWVNHTLDKRKMLIANHIDACAVFKKEIWENVSGYSEDMPYMGCEDWNFWQKCIYKKYNFFYLNEICFEYRVLSNSMIRTIPEDFQQKIFSYNCNQNYQLYFQTLKADQDILHNVFSGNVFKKVIKLILNHFGKYRY